MINNVSDQPGGGKPDFQSLVDQAVAEGVIGGIVAFMQHNRVNIKPTDKSVSPIKDFTGLLLAEYIPDGSEIYPFQASFKGYVAEHVAENLDILKRLYAAEELGNLNKVCHVIGGGAVANFLEERRVDVLKLIAGIRGE